MKEKDYTVTIDIHVSKDEKPNSPRWYSLKIYGHPISEAVEPIRFDISNMRDEQVLKLGKNVLDAIWDMVGKKDSEFWKG